MGFWGVKTVVHADTPSAVRDPAGLYGSRRMRPWRQRRSAGDLVSTGNGVRFSGCGPMGSEGAAPSFFVHVFWRNFMCRTDRSARFANDRLWLRAGARLPVAEALDQLKRRCRNAEHPMKCA